jgi:hypothetical protein
MLRREGGELLGEEGGFEGYFRGYRLLGRGSESKLALRAFPLAMGSRCHLEIVGVWRFYK